ncbi:hypothetical protein [Streptomyces sp. GC420]|uniref:hypothetical protein n=1 Tax=Streptomyces sp. GC420 TaxID=2697568 RepID=UPI001414EBF3|nr:hypothetical protein [Streptomyces sp. GC420]NBM20142.1 hypothetical protein [Streptomyces sp. GC420]
MIMEVALRAIGLTLASQAIDDYMGFAYSAQQQAEEIRSWARRHGHEVIAVSDAYSPGMLSRAESALEQGNVKLVVLSSDRLADFFPSPYYFEILSRLCYAPFTGRVVAADTNVVLRIEERQQVAEELWRAARGRVLEWDDEMERLPPRIDLMKNGRRRKYEQGGYAYGAPPYGWVAVEGGLAPDSREQEALARARELRDQGYTLRSICEVLDAERHLTRSGRPWSSGALSRILDRPPPRPESVVPIDIIPSPRHRDGSRGRGRLKLRDMGEAP